MNIKLTKIDKKFEFCEIYRMKTFILSKILEYLLRNKTYFFKGCSEK